MTTDRKSDSEVFREALIDEAHVRSGEHPGLDALVDYLEGTLDSQANEQVADHLAGCPECATAALDLGTLVMPDASAQDGVADLEIESSWRVMQSRLERPSEVGEPRPRTLPEVRRWPLALAASLLLATVGLSVWVSQLLHTKADLRDQVARLSEPRVNPPIVYLDEGERSEPAGPVVELGPDEPFVLLIVIPSAPELFSSYQAVVTDGTGQVVWEGSGLELSDEETLRLSLPRVLLSEADYRVRVVGVAQDRIGSSTESLVDTSLRVVHK